MKHWYVPGVYTRPSIALPRSKNLSRDSEHVYGTSHRDGICFSYTHIKSLINFPESLQNYLYTHAYRIIFKKLENSSIPNYQSLSYHERLDLCITEGLITESLRALVYQIEFETDPIRLISVFLNFLKEIQNSPLEFQPLFDQLVKDKEIFEDETEVKSLNKNFVRVL
jgi:hypothetical protein